MRENYTLARLYLTDDLSSGCEIELEKAHVHYVATVLRLFVGDRLRVFNGRDGEWAAEIAHLDRKRATLSIGSRLRAPYESPDIWLCFAPVRKHRNAFILEKATELGVAKFLPVITHHTQFPKIRLDKMTAQIIEAAEQTERLDVPEICDGQSLDTLISDWPEARTLIFADEAGEAAPALDVLQSLNRPAAILIGPEGGFSDAERATLRAQDFVTSVSLGPRILRADTAVLSVLTLWQATQGDWIERGGST